MRPINVHLHYLQPSHSLSDAVIQILCHHMAIGRDYTGSSAAKINSEGILSLPTPHLRLPYVPNKILLYCTDSEITTELSTVMHTASVQNTTN
jgi:hypothetical protein